MGADGRRGLLLIGEVAGLLGSTPKAVRHYEKLGLLDEPRRSASGYRLYAAEDLLRLHRIKVLQSLGLSLGRIEGVLAGSASGAELGKVLEALLGEVDSQIGRLEQRRDLLERMLAGGDPAGGDPAGADEEPRMLELVRRHLGGRWSALAPDVLEQEKKVWATLDAFRWPREYEEFQEALVRYLADRPEELGKLLTLEERLAALSGLPEDASEVGRLAEDYAAHFGEHPFPQELPNRAAWGSGPLEAAFLGVALNAVSPAQKRCMELLVEHLSGGGDER